LNIAQSGNAAMPSDERETIDQLDQIIRYCGGGDGGSADRRTHPQRL